MHRRQVLVAAAGGLAGLAGCVGGCTYWTDLTFEPLDSEGIADRESTSDIDGGSALVTELARDTLEGEEPTLETLSRSPLSWLQYVEWDGGYYEIHEEVVAEGEVSGPEYELSRGRDDEPELDDDALSFEELPVVDQWRLNEAADFAIDQLSSMSFETTVIAGYLSEDATAQSVLADGIEQSTLSVDGTRAELTKLDDTTASAERIQFSAIRVADDAEAFATDILEEQGAELPAVSDDVEWLLQSVREDDDNRISICRSDDEDEDDDRLERQQAAVDELQTVMNDLEADPDTPDRISYVRFEDEWHHISLGETVV